MLLLKRFGTEGDDCMPPKKKKPNLTKINLVFDSLIFIMILTSLDPWTTGQVIHEWMGVALMAAVITHLLLHWKWISQVIPRFFRRLGGNTRLKIIVNLLFFVNITVVIFSGLTISLVAMPTLGIHIGRGLYLRRLHTLATNLIVFTVGLHAAIHWKWILDAIKRYIVKPVGHLLKRSFPGQAEVPEVE